MARILVIDDDAGDRKLIHDHLAGTGHVLVDAESGERGLELARTVPPPDLVLCDVLLPGIHGFEVVRRLKDAAGPSFLPVMLVTSLSDHSSRVLGFRSGADDFLPKP